MYKKLINLCFATLLMALSVDAYSASKLQFNPDITIHGLSLGMTFSKAEKILKKEGFSRTKNEGKNFIEYRLKSDSVSAKLGVMFTEKNNNGKIYSFSFSTNRYKFKTTNEAEAIFRKIFGKNITIYHKKKRISIKTVGKSGNKNIQIQANTRKGSNIRGQIKLNRI